MLYDFTIFIQNTLQEVLTKKLVRKLCSVNVTSKFYLCLQNHSKFVQHDYKQSVNY